MKRIIKKLVELIENHGYWLLRSHGYNDWDIYQQGVGGKTNEENSIL